MRKWKVEFGRVKAKGKGLNPFFSSGGPKDAGQPGKKKEVGGVSGGRRQRAYYACLEVEVWEKRARRRSPGLLRSDARRREGGFATWTCPTISWEGTASLGGSNRAQGRKREEDNMDRGNRC